MKCSICNNPFEDGLVEIVNGEPVHPECRAEEEAKMEQAVEQAVVDAEYTEVTTEGVGNVAPQHKCEIVVGMEENGDLYFLARGKEPTLLNIEGLIKFAQLKMAQIWADRMETDAKV